MIKFHPSKSGFIFDNLYPHQESAWSQSMPKLQLNGELDDGISYIKGSSAKAMVISGINEESFQNHWNQKRVKRNREDKTDNGSDN